MSTEWGSRETVLIVDDDRAVCLSLKRQLEHAGYLAHCVNDGPAALSFAADSTADLVILDLVMPGMDGLETCRRLQALPGWAKTPVLILTGSQEGELYARAMECGADDFLTKPVRTEELLLRVKALIRIRGLVADLQVSVATVQAQNELILRTREMREKLEAFLLHDLKNPIGGILLQAEMRLPWSPRTPPPGSTSWLRPSTSRSWWFRVKLPS